jgi:flagellar basal body-associated protein FliL
MPELIVIFLALIFLALPVGAVIALAWYFSSRKKPPQIPQSPKSVQEKLSEIDDLRSRNLISEAEYEEKRMQILSDI